ncbi:type II secretory pathway [Leptospira ryugenii]|uniref:Type II secretion system protein J n=1 Tax=Leptospira ryugenii TaxID=1917863 RepID=A0A2P2DWT0_9LEPT|nr:type II secretion system protein GspJ [Leptospira ryugenii]GBF49077.1 type II secretory pathway [Leptospira ryugenii]
MRKGFTLVEISIVILLLGITMTAMFTVFYTSNSMAKKGRSEKGANRREILYAIENIRGSLARTYFIDNQRRVLFVGKAEGGGGEKNDRIVFCSSNPNSEEEEAASVREVSFFLRKMENPKRPDLFYLIRREDEMVDNFPTQGGIEHILLENVKSFQLKYSERGEKWVDDWNSRTTKKIPRLIRIEIVSLVGNTFLKYESLAHPVILHK